MYSVVTASLVLTHHLSKRRSRVWLKALGTCYRVSITAEPVFATSCCEVLLGNLIWSLFALLPQTDRQEERAGHGSRCGAGPTAARTYLSM